MKERALVIVLSVVAFLAVGVIVVYAFGKPQAPSVADQVVRSTPDSAAQAAPVDGSDAGAGGEGAVDPTSGEVPEPDPASPLAIEIPGCVCHSDDPAIVDEHANYRMNQCFGCHAGGMPEMGQ